jgi:hypothetical protein
VDAKSVTRGLLGAAFSSVLALAAALSAASSAVAAPLRSVSTAVPGQVASAAALPDASNVLPAAEGFQNSVPFGIVTVIIFITVYVALTLNAGHGKHRE